MFSEEKQAAQEYMQYVTVYIKYKKACKTIQYVGKDGDICGGAIMKSKGMVNTKSRIDFTSGIAGGGRSMW